MGRSKDTTKVRLGSLFVAMDMPKMENVFFSYPQLVSNIDPAGCNDAMPKSAILMLLLRSRSRFSGFKSR